MARDKFGERQARLGSDHWRRDNKRFIRVPTGDWKKPVGEVVLVEPRTREELWQLRQREERRLELARKLRRVLQEGERGWLSHPRDTPNREDKGLRDGACNRTACQDSLAGLPRWSMRDYSVSGGRLYYCPSCSADFTETDLQFREPIRCEIIPEDEL